MPSGRLPSWARQLSWSRWSFIKASFEFMSSLWTHVESRQAGITRSSIMICMMFYNQQITKLPHDVEVHFTMGLRSLWEWIEALVFTCWEERCSWYRACLHGAYTGMRGALFDGRIGGEDVLDGVSMREPAPSLLASGQRKQGALTTSSLWERWK